MTTTLEDLKILRLRDVKQQIGLGRSSIYQMVKDGVFPRPVTLGYRSVGWLACDICEWLQAKRAGISYKQKPVSESR